MRTSKIVVIDLDDHDELNIRYHGLVLEVKARPRPEDSGVALEVKSDNVTWLHGFNDQDPQVDEGGINLTIV